MLVVYYHMDEEQRKSLIKRLLIVTTAIATLERELAIEDMRREKKRDRETLWVSSRHGLGNVNNYHYHY